MGTVRKRVSLAMMTLQNEIHTYVAEEMQKGFEYPVTGIKRGHLFKTILSKLSPERRVKFFHETGRFQNIGNDNSEIKMTGFLGTDWCPSLLDDELFLEMYDKAVQLQ